MKRIIRIALMAMLAATALGTAGCARQVEVRTGTKVVCTYGEVVSDDVRLIKVPAKEAGEHHVRTVTKICDRHAELEALYQAAQQALAANDLATARVKLEQVVAIDAAFGNAASQLGTIASGKKPEPDKNPTAGPTATTAADKPGEDSTGVPAESLLSWAPDALTGFTASKPAVDPLSIARQYVPAQGSDVVTFVITAEQFSSNEMAKEGLTGQVKNVYTKGKDTFNLNGHSVYFGTDGSRYAAVGLVKGSVLVALEMSGKPGQSPAALRSALEDAVKELPR
jgi:hypothetical protein